MFKKTWVTILIVFLFLQSCTSINNRRSREIEDKIPGFNQVILDFEERQIMMGSFLIRRNGEVLYEKTTGARDIVESELIYSDNQTKYRIGSVTKIFTSVMILMAIENNLIHFDTPLSDFFPLIGNSEIITIQNMLQHRSGLFNYINSPDFINRYEIYITKDGLLEFIYSLGNHKIPNTEFEYSNANYLLLGFILEEIYQKPYKDLVREMIIEPLELNNTYYAETIITENNESRSFILKNGYETSIETNLSWARAAGALVSTAADLAVFIESLFNGKLLPADIFNKMIATDGNGVGLGIGFDQRPNSIFYGFYGHIGGVDQFSSYVYYNPETKATYIFLINGFDGGSDGRNYRRFNNSLR